MVAAGLVLLDRYRVDGRVASGGMADVYSGRDLRLERQVAIKVLRTGPGDARRFRAEARVLADLTHPHLVRVYDAGEHEGLPFLVLEWVDGPTLAGLLAADGPLPDHEVRRIGGEVAAALADVHAAGIVHRDVKPSNILLDAGGRAMLADFGIALALDATRLTTEGTIGTLAYLAPEQLSPAAPVSGAIDVHALGLVLLEAATGRAAFTGVPAEIAAAKLTRAATVDVDEPGLRRLLERMVAVDPGLRPSAGEVAATLVALDAPHLAPTEPIGAAAGSRTQPFPLPGSWVHPTVELAGTDRNVGLGGRRPDPSPHPEDRHGRPRARAVLTLTAAAVALASFVAAVAVWWGPTDGVSDDGTAGATTSTTAATTTTTTTTTTTASSPTTASTAGAPAATAPADPPAGGSASAGRAEDGPPRGRGEGRGRDGAPPSGEGCDALEAEEEAIEAEEERAEERHRDDRDTSEQVKRELEEEKRAIEERKDAARC